MPNSTSYISIDLSRTEARLLAYLAGNAQRQVDDPVLQATLHDLRHLLLTAVRHQRKP